MPDEDYRADRADARAREAREREERERYNREHREEIEGRENAARDARNRPEDFSEAFTGWVSGQTAREDAARDRQDQEDAEAKWLALGSGGPTAEDLTTDYYFEGGRDEYGDLLGGESEFARHGIAAGADQQAAMQALRNLYESGGYTDADRAASQAMRAQQGQALGSANAASMQQMQARGMGGSGAELAMRMGSSEAMAGNNAQADASIQQAAMNRALGALQGYGQMATAYRSGEHERMGALDAYNQQNMDWRRGRESRNTGWANRGQESQTEARQQRWENERSALSGLSGESAQGDDVEARNRARMDARSQATMDSFGAAFSAAGG